MPEARAGGPLEAGEASHETQRPDAGKAQQRQRAKDGKKPLATTIGPEHRGDPAPLFPREAKVHARQPQAPTDGAR